ncbi:MAG TPA: glutathione S-transferase N-terminal domain-containing protein [Aliidongia sp.]|nr:glutathione S-transferase N-terminal domain-containing protein [Aliidongia sp.]
MRLFYSSTSPYVRKFMVLAHETGLAGRIELKPVSVSPVTRNPEVAAGNPLVKVPTLLLDDGTSLYDSPVISEYLDTLHAGRPWFPVPGPARWAALRRQAMADGALDAAILIRYELTLRPEDKRWPAWIDGQMVKIRQSLDALEAEAATFGPDFTIGEIAVGCTLAYLDYRFGAEEWRKNRPALAAFDAAFAARPSMVATRPPA